MTECASFLNAPADSSPFLIGCFRYSEDFRWIGSREFSEGKRGVFKVPTRT